jgi:hypothetical protein
MTAPLRQDRIGMDPVAAFTARAQARAILWAAGEIDLHSAVDELWAVALGGGLVKKVGRDRVQRILAEAFVPAHEDLLLVDLLGDLAPTADAAAEAEIIEPPDGEYGGNGDFDGPNGDYDGNYEGLSSTFARACRAADARVRARRERQRDHPEKPHVAETTLEALEFLVKQRDPERLRAWLSTHSAEERAAILQHLERKARRNDRADTT